MARLQGLKPAYRKALTAAVDARDAEAVAELRARPSGAGTRCAHLAFEVAGQIQAEIDGVDWTVAKKKVSRMDPHDLRRWNAVTGYGAENSRTAVLILGCD